MNNFCVVTTINPPTKSIEVLYKKFGENLIIVGDKKTPEDWNCNGIIPQPDNNSHYAPYNHYARKNLGYLAAIKNGAGLIYDSDDDNTPNKHWEIRRNYTFSNKTTVEGWYNPYKEFTKEHIWPRGFSLRHLNIYTPIDLRSLKTSSIQQGMADGEPDVDAIWRLVFNKRLTFEKEANIFLNRNTWCPFNSQSTWWFPKAYPLMYLPIYASFRMTDIWRSFVAQRCLWEIGEGVTFHSPSEVFQDRNEHDLLKDFELEVDGYLKNDLIVDVLSGLELKQGEDFVCDNLFKCYQALVEENILPYHELTSLEQWITDYKKWKH